MATKLNLKALLANLLACASIDDTDDFWSIRKYANGEAECWGTITTTQSHYASWSVFNGYKYAITFPSNLFKSGTKPTVNFQPRIGDGWAIPATVFLNGTTGATLYALANASGNQTVEWHIIVKGVWK